MAAVLIVVLVFGVASVGHANAVSAERATDPATAVEAQVRQVPAGLGRVTAIAAGWVHNLALRSDGTVVAWGWNAAGQLGDGTTIDRRTPVRVCAAGESAPCTRFLTGVIAVAAGEKHSLALLRDRTVVAWGYNGEGQLGDGTNVDRRTPVRVCAVGQVAPCGQFLGGVRALSSGIHHTLAQLTNGTAVSWGWNFYNSLGDGTTVDRRIPVRVCAVGQVAPCQQFLTGIRSLAAGVDHSLALVDNAQAVAWGWNVSGQLGDGTVQNRATPVRVCAVGQVAPCDRFLYGVRAVVGGDIHSMALLGDGSVLSWGDNDEGQLGDGTTVDRRTPVRVCAVGQVAPCAQFLYGIRHIEAGGYHSLAQLSSGGVLTWGNNGQGQLGDGTTVDRSIPVRVCAVGQVAPCTRYLFQIRAVSAGGYHSLALQPDYTVVAWGFNGLGQIGDGTTVDRPVPVQVLAPPVT